MPMHQPSVSLGEGIAYTEMHDAKFKTCALYLRLLLPCVPEKVAERALVIDLLTNCSAAYPTLAALALRKQALYGASLHSQRQCAGDVQELTLVAKWLDDRFALDGDHVTEAMLDLTLGCLLRPNVQEKAFDVAAFRFARQNLLDTIDGEINQKRSYALQKGAELAFAGEPAACPSYGTRADAEHVTPASAYAAWQEILQTARIEVVAITPTEKPQIREKLMEELAGLQHRAPLPIVFETPSPVKAEVAVVEEPMPVTQSKMVLVFKIAETNHDVMAMLNLILGGTTGSLLFANVREKKSLCYYCASRYQRRKHALIIDCGVRTDQLAEAKQAILEQVDLLRAGDFTDAQMEEAVLFQANSYASAADAHGGIAYWILNQRTHDVERSMEETLEAMRAVTRDEIIEAAKQMQLDTVYILRAEAEEHAEEGAAE